MKIWAIVQGGVCIRRVWATDEEAVALGAVADQPWYVEGVDVAASLANYNAAQAAKVTAAAALQTVIDDPQRVALTAALRGATNAQIDAYIDANVTNLATATTMLKRMCKVMALLVQ